MHILSVSGELDPYGVFWFSPIDCPWVSSVNLGEFHFSSVCIFIAKGLFFYLYHSSQGSHLTFQDA